MNKKFRGKYRTESIRLKGWDYGSNATYFITICTKNRKHYFGEIINKKMHLSQIGMVAVSCWEDIRNHFPFVRLVVMPNHVHGIIIVEKNEKPKQASENKFGPQSKNLGSIMRGFKVGVKKYATLNKLDFEWQPRYYESIIRNGRSYYKVTNYIKSNPSSWKEDNFYN
ncbi:hypothetical protein AB832_00280 [Flavobacteriaceae bacterium (ex Bugula neritina AB1)]|nr:hypothetical protein AB832_00280 [Flavobacteriaceae bacterium (ex Bugula neritina AB1)]